MLKPINPEQTTAIEWDGYTFEMYPLTIAERGKLQELMKTDNVVRTLSLVKEESGDDDSVHGQNAMKIFLEGLSVTAVEEISYLLARKCRSVTSASVTFHGQDKDNLFLYSAERTDLIVLAFRLLAFGKLDQVERKNSDSSPVM